MGRKSTGLATELATLLFREGADALAALATGLRFHAPCGRDTDGCRGFYTAPPDD